MKFREIKPREQPKRKKLSPEEEAKIIKYWLVEITLTSGKGLQFYVSGKTQYDAQQKADAYASWPENEQLLNNLLLKFRLRT